MIDGDVFLSLWDFCQMYLIQSRNSDCHKQVSLHLAAPLASRTAPVQLQGGSGRGPHVPDLPAALRAAGGHALRPHLLPRLHEQLPQGGPLFFWNNEKMSKNAYFFALQVNQMCPLDRKPVNEMSISPSNLVLKRWEIERGS